MRISLSLVLAIGCSSSTREPVRPSVASPATRVSDRCPVGDGVNVAVYTFLAREMAERTTGSRDATRAAVANEAKMLLDPSLKPPRASIVEHEVSHILTTLCEGTPGCVTAAIYDRGGLAIALSSLHSKVATYGIADDARWGQLTASSSADSGADFELTCEEAKAAGLPCTPEHRVVAFPVFDNATLVGLATCIVER